MTNSPSGRTRFYQLAKVSVSGLLLRIQRVGSNVIISWPTNAVGFVLQSKTAFDATSVWASVAGVPRIAGDRFYVTNSASGLSRFYQLAKPVPWSPQALLTIVKSGNDVAVSWPASVSDYILESSTELMAGAAWSAVDGLPSVVGNTVTVPASGTVRFFRLRR